MFVCEVSIVAISEEMNIRRIHQVNDRHQYWPFRSLEDKRADEAVHLSDPIVDGEINIYLCFSIKCMQVGIVLLHFQLNLYKRLCPLGVYSLPSHIHLSSMSSHIVQPVYGNKRVIEMIFTNYLPN